jgi:hypothetical protein
MVVLIDFGGAVAQIFHMEGSSLKGKSLFPVQLVFSLPGPGT